MIPVRIARVVGARLRAFARVVPTRLPVALSAWVVLYGMGLAIRATTYALMDVEGNNPISFDRQAITFAGYLGWSEGDFVWAAFGAGALAVPEWFGGRRWPRMLLVLAAMVVGATAVILLVHCALLFAMETGFSWEAINEFFYAPSPGDLEAALEAWHLGFFPGSLIVFAILVWLPARGRAAAALATLALAGAARATVYVRPDWPKVYYELRAHGGIFLLDEVLTNVVYASHRFRDRPVSVSTAQSEILALVDPLFADESAPGGPLIERIVEADVPRNVVVMLMESVPYLDIGLKRPDGTDLMPVLQGLRSRGAWANRHHAAANSSASATFSLVTGLFAMPEMAVYALRPDLELPGLPRLLGRDFDAFLVTPGRLESFFPRALLQRNGFDDLRGYYNLPADVHQRSWSNARDERSTFDYFRQRVAGAREPFFAVFYSYATHYPYHDYGADTHVLPPDSKRERFLNNLGLTDRLLGELIEDLDRAGRFEDTVLVVVGDHGEAFRQHKKNVTHARASYEENLHVPFVLVYPPGIPPTEVASLTSHADLAPTLLDLFSVPYDPRDFQGTSLLRPLPAIRRTFAMGNEGAITTWREDGRKTIVNIHKDTCRCFDLAVDPTEQTNLGCEDNDAELDALLGWRLHQIRDVKVRNAKLRALAQAEAAEP